MSFANDDAESGATYAVVGSHWRMSYTTSSDGLADGVQALDAVGAGGHGGKRQAIRVASSDLVRP